MKIIFDYDKHEDRDSVGSLLKHGELLSNMEGVFNIVRNWLKHGDTSHLKEEEIERLEEIKRLSGEVYE